VKGVIVVKCKRVRRKLSAYLDGELNDKGKEIITEHLKECTNCRKEFTILSEQDELVTKLEAIEPSVNFRIRFWKKVRESEGKEVVKKMPRLSWLPVPVMSLLIVIIISYVSGFYFTLYAKGENLRTQIETQVLENFIASAHPLNPISLLNFCNECWEALCRRAQSQKVSSKCICGRCENQ